MCWDDSNEKNHLTFVNCFLKEILDEMEQTALDILNEAAVNEMDDEEDDSD